MYDNYKKPVIAVTTHPAIINYRLKNPNWILDNIQKKIKVNFNIKWRFSNRIKFSFEYKKNV
jgi:predicted transglutaminase-like cysteine proteinase